MENISCFKLSSSFEAASTGGTLAYPNTSYIEDTAKLHLLSSYKKNYMYVEALEDDTLVSFKCIDNDTSSVFIDPYNILEYSVDQQTWNTISTDGTATTINTGEKLYFRGECTDIRFDTETYTMGIGTFLVTKTYNVGGNIMSLLFGDNFENKIDLTGYDNVFAQLFCVMFAPNGDKNKMVSAENLLLPATTLASQCYYYMFRDCTSLVNVPQLPATTLAPYCYAYMFAKCTSLVNVPQLPATTLAEYCYDGMFYGCTSLVTAPELPATTLASYCYSWMFDGCTSLVNAPSLPALELAEWCYWYMFYGCTSLVTAPELPATTLAPGCYSFMFRDCTSITTAPELPATELTKQCYYYMFGGCTSLTTAPVLHVNELAESCYAYMFYGCTNLSSVTMLATKRAPQCIDKWLDGTANAGTLYKHPDMTIYFGDKPFSWTAVDYVAS